MKIICKNPYCKKEFFARLETQKYCKCCRYVYNKGLIAKNQAKFSKKYRERKKLEAKK